MGHKPLVSDLLHLIQTPPMGAVVTLYLFYHKKLIKICEYLFIGKNFKLFIDHFSVIYI